MRSTTTNAGDQLAGALHALGVHFIMGGKGRDESLLTQPECLIAALAQSDEARLRLALIPLFLEHPEYGAHVLKAAQSLDPGTRLTLQCYYTAAVWLAKKYHLSGAPLSDHFSKELGLNPVDNPDENLRMLASRHKYLSDSYVNWLATYQHAEQVWRRSRELRQG